MDIRSLSITLISLALGALALAGGCNRPVWDQKSEERMANIHNHASWYTDYNAAGSERMESTAGLIRKRRSYHEEHLEQTSDMVRKEMESDENRWHDEQPKRRAFARQQWRGNPDTIPSTWAKMVY